MFFVAFNIIIRHIFPENFIEIPQWKLINIDVNRAKVENTML